jgi:hypothetical protein
MTLWAPPMSNPSCPAPTGVSGATLILSLALSQAVGVCATTVIILGILYLRPPLPSGGERGEAGGASEREGVLAQHGTVPPQGKFSDIVYYPSPYGLPPNLTLTSPKRTYDIVKQDEKGFTWKAVPNPDEFTDAGRKQWGGGVFARDMAFLNGQNALKPNLQLADFTWEAKGVRAGKDTILLQEGPFNTIAGKEGPVNFPIPYEIAPNVELSGQPAVMGMVIIADIRPTGFKWLNAGKDEKLHSGTLTWKAKGIRATDIPQAKGQ